MFNIPFLNSLPPDLGNACTTDKQTVVARLKLQAASSARASQPSQGGNNDDHARSRKRRSRNNGYADPRERKRPEVTIVLSVYQGVTAGWRTVPFTFNPYKINDEELWTDIRELYRHSLQKEWRRIFLFKRLKAIVPIEVEYVKTRI